MTTRHRDRFSRRSPNHPSDTGYFLNKRHCWSFHVHPKKDAPIKFILLPALTLTFLSTRAVAAPASETIEFCGQTFKLKTKSVSCSGDKDADARLAITDFTALGELKRLSTLSLNRVEVSDLSSLSTLPKLKRLSIRDSSSARPNPWVRPGPSGWRSARLT